MTSFLFVTDLDNTLVGDDQALAELNRRLSQHRQAFGMKIVYATGRSLALYRQLKAQKHLLEPDALLAAVGTEVYLHGSDTPEPIWSKRIAPKWNRNLVLAVTAHFADLIPQPDSEQGLFKVSFLLTQTAAVEVLPQLEYALQKQGLETKLIYSTGQDLDILPRHSDKGLAMQFLQKQWGFEPQQTVVCGDSGNDIALFSMGEERGIIVGNAQPELLRWHQAHLTSYHYQAQAFCAGGILEGLNHFGFFQ